MTQVQANVNMPHPTPPHPTPTPRGLRWYVTKMSNLWAGKRSDCINMYKPSINGWIEALIPTDIGLAGCWSDSWPFSTGELFRTLQQPQIHLFLINKLLTTEQIHRRIISVQLRNCKKPVGTPKSWGLPTGWNDQVSMIRGSKTMRKNLPNAPGLTFPLGRLRCPAWMSEISPQFSQTWVWNPSGNTRPGNDCYSSLLKPWPSRNSACSPARKWWNFP